MVEELAAKGLVDDSRFCQVYLRHHARLRPRSKRILRRDLLREGCDLETIQRAMQKMGVERLYNLSEFHSDGIDSVKLKDHLLSLGFKMIQEYHHWHGLSRFTDLLFRERRFSKERGPLSCIIAQKQ